MTLNILQKGLKFLYVCKMQGLTAQTIAEIDGYDACELEWTSGL